MAMGSDRGSRGRSTSPRRVDEAVVEKPGGPSNEGEGICFAAYANACSSCCSDFHTSDKRNLAVVGNSSVDKGMSIVLNQEI